MESSPLPPQAPFNPDWSAAEAGVIAAARAAVQSGRVLEPTDRIIEVLCGLIMVLTFTLATPLSDHSGVHSMLIAALGCNLAWGIVDATMYLMTQLTERRTALRALRALRKTSDSGAAHRIIIEALPPVLAAVLCPAELEAIRSRLNQLPEPGGPRLPRSAWRGALGVFLLVFLSTFPVVIPFAVVGDFRAARLISNIIAISMMFIAGYSFGRSVGYHPALVGLVMVAFGGALVLTTIVFGG